jgi:taurine dioxygenase
MMRCQEDAFPGFVEGIDCRKLSDTAVSELLLNVFRHRVLVVRDQKFEPAEFAHFMRRFGPTIPHVLDQFRLEGLSDIIVISNLYDIDGRPKGVHDGGSYWHSDMSYFHQSGVLTALYSVKIPVTGGETEFVDCVGALDRFRQAVALNTIPLDIASLDHPNTRVTHRFGNRARLNHSDARYQPITDAQAAALSKEVQHPLILVHPVIDTESFYAVAGTAFGLDNLPPDESCDLLDRLLEFILSAGPQYSHRYRPGDLVIWDNATTLHRGTDIPPSRDSDNCRLLLRANVNYAVREKRTER